MLIQRTHRVPRIDGSSGDALPLARQLDVALMRIGFKLTPELFQHLGELEWTDAMLRAELVLDAARQAVGGHVQHNTYFKDFPRNVPDTHEFWLKCLVDALHTPHSGEKVVVLQHLGAVNLLDLPRYGRYLHSYEEMASVHAQLIPADTDRMTLLHLGGTLAEELERLYLSLAGSTVPLSADDLELLRNLARLCTDGSQPLTIPVRENRAVVNAVRLRAHYPLLVDTVTDILRLAVSLSNGDVSLQETTKFRSFRRSERRALLSALDDLIGDMPNKLADISQHNERWKRLGEGLHPSDYPQLSNAQVVFRVARGEQSAPSLAARVQAAFELGQSLKAAELLSGMPGRMFRSLDHLLRTTPVADYDELFKLIENTSSQVSGRVLLSVREHFQNRILPEPVRIFMNRQGRSWVTEDARPPLDYDVVDRLLSIIDLEVDRRMTPPLNGRLVINTDILSVALPLSDKSKAAGLSVLPRGSLSMITGEVLRFFIYWKQRHNTTDYDLSALQFDRDMNYCGHVSWTNLKGNEIYHSGDLIEAPNGASEFIDVPLKQVPRDVHVIVPQVFVYSGESFDEAEEAFFGFMERSLEQLGMPFEERTVRMKSDLSGSNRVTLPLAFVRGEAGWTAHWLHLYLKGQPRFNTVEANRLTVARQVKAVVERQFLPVGYLVNCLVEKSHDVVMGDAEHIASCRFDAPVTYIGLEVPQGLPEGSQIISLQNLHELTPA